MTNDEFNTLMQKVYERNKAIAAQAAEAAKVPDLESAISLAKTAQKNAEDALASAKSKLGDITGNTLYKLLPSWIREKIEAMFK
jgi:hypothetical protein